MFHYKYILIIQLKAMQRWHIKFFFLVISNMKCIWVSLSGFIFLCKNLLTYHSTSLHQQFKVHWLFLCGTSTTPESLAMILNGTKMIMLKNIFKSLLFSLIKKFQNIRLLHFFSKKPAIFESFQRFSHRNIFKTIRF